MSTVSNTRLSFGGRPQEPAGRPGPLTPPSGVRVLCILAGIAWRRLGNQTSTGVSFFGRKKSAADPAVPRRATPGKGNAFVRIYLFLIPAFMVGSAFQAYSFVGRLSDLVSPAPSEAPHDRISDPSTPGQGADGSAADSGRPSADGPRWPLAPDDRLLASAFGLALLVLSLGCVAAQFGGGGQDLGKVEWDMEWLFTFPVSARTLLAARLLQNATTSPFALMYCMITLPTLSVLYGCAGHGWWSLPLAAAATAYGALLIASVCLVVETWVQKKCTPAGRKNLQAVFGLVGGMMLLVYVVSVAQNAFDSKIVDAARALPETLWANPFSLPAWFCVGGAAPWGASAGMALLGVAAPIGAVGLAGWFVRDGLVAAPGAQQSSRRRWRADAGKAGGWFRGVIGKDLRLLARDRTFLVQTLVMPVLIAAFYFFLYWHAGTGLLQDPRHAAALAFGMGAYVLSFSAFQVLTAEGGALWLLYTFPRKLHSILLEKTCLWCGIAALYALAVLGVAALSGMPLDGAALAAGVYAVGGVVLYSFVASALGVLATNPLEVTAQRRVRLDLAYFFMALASSYVAALYSPSMWAMIVQAALTALTAFAFWQKVQDRIPYLLEPAESPPPRLSLADGLIAAQAYLTVQILVLLIMQAAEAPLSPSTRLLIATGVAGAVAATGALLFLRRATGVLALTGLTASTTEPRPTIRQVVLPGLLAGVLAGLFGAAYMVVVARIDALRSWNEILTAVPSPLADPVWFAWVVLAAPLCEEFLFRGLVYRGMQRSMRPSYAVLGSAALFALLHPPFKVVPVFVLGVAAALSFRRSRLLWTPILTHVVYNAIVVTVAWIM